MRTDEIEVAEIHRRPRAADQVFQNLHDDPARGQREQSANEGLDPTRFLSEVAGHDKQNAEPSELIAEFESGGEAAGGF